MAGRPELVLNVAEKNDAAKELSKVMCRGYPRMVSYNVLLGHVFSANSDNIRIK